MIAYEHEFLKVREKIEQLIENVRHAGQEGQRIDEVERMVLSELLQVGFHLMTRPVDQIMHSEKKFDSLVSKREVAKALRALVGSFGLCFRCPKTKEPTVLIGHAGDDSRGRFQFVSHRAVGWRAQKRTLSATELPELVLTAEPTTPLDNAFNSFCRLTNGPSSRSHYPNLGHRR